MKRFDLCGIGNAIVDILIDISEEDFRRLGFEKGTMTLVDAAEQQQLLAQFASRDPALVSGGSVANSVFGLVQLGGRGAYICCIGDDRYGLHYQSECEELQIDLGNAVLVGQSTGTCVSLVTPDAERTMRTALAVSAKLSPKQVDERRIRDSKWLFIEGYLFANPDQGCSAIDAAVEFARKNGTKIAVTCSEAFIPEVFGEKLNKVLAHADLLFCNNREACALSGAATANEAFGKLSKDFPGLAVTAGAEGAYIQYGGERGHVPAYPCTPRDLTGAGDMFAGAFLYGVTQGLPALTAARAANFLARQVIVRMGARLPSGAKEYWAEALAGRP